MWSGCFYLRHFRAGEAIATVDGQSERNDQVAVAHHKAGGIRRRATKRFPAPAGPGKTTWSATSLTVNGGDARPPLEL